MRDSKIPIKECLYSISMLYSRNRAIAHVIAYALRMALHTGECILGAVGTHDKWA